MMRHGSPNTSCTMSAVTMSAGFLRHHPSRPHRDDVVGVAEGVVQVVQYRDEGSAGRAVEFGAQFEQIHLIGDVEVGWLARRAASARSAVPAASPSRPADADRRTIRRRAFPTVPLTPVAGHRLHHGGLVVASPPPDQFLMREPAARDEIGDADAVGCDRRPSGSSPRVRATCLAG